MPGRWTARSASPAARPRQQVETQQLKQEWLGDTCWTGKMDTCDLIDASPAPNCATTRLIYTESRPAVHTSP